MPIPTAAAPTPCHATISARPRAWSRLQRFPHRLHPDRIGKRIVRRGPDCVGVSGDPAYRAEVAIAIVIIVTVINLRGVKESGAVFAVPTYGFIILMLLTMGIGGFKALTGTLGTVPNPPELTHALHGAETLGLFLILKAFSSGCAALTGVEAISNGIQAFKEPRSRNAANTLLVMSDLWVFSSLARHCSPPPRRPSPLKAKIRHLANRRTVLGQGTLLYGALVFATTMILVVAANTSFADFPRLSALAARDGYVPRQLGVRGSRLVFNYGIVALAGASCLLILVFDAEVTRLIPLYTIGVFLSFTLSQSGMVMRWIRSSRLKPGEAIETPGHTPPLRQSVALEDGDRRPGRNADVHRDDRVRDREVFGWGVGDCGPDTAARLWVLSHAQALSRCRPHFEHQVPESAQHPANADPSFYHGR